MMVFGIFTTRAISSSQKATTTILPTIGVTGISRAAPYRFLAVLLRFRGWMGETIAFGSSRLKALMNLSYGATKPLDGLSLVGAISQATITCTEGRSKLTGPLFGAGFFVSPVSTDFEPQLRVFVTGAALIAGGGGLVVPKRARLAALLVALMVSLWVLMLPIPRAISTWPEVGETAAIFEALALSGTALIVAGWRLEKR